MSEKQHIQEQHVMQIIPPARLTDEMLEQIRAVVREEVAVAKKQTTWTPEDEDAFLRGVLRSRLSMGIMSLSGYRAELASLDNQKSKGDVHFPAIKSVQFSSETVNIEAELEYEGKRYQGTLYYVGNVAQCDLSVKNTELVSGTIVKNYELTDLGKSIVGDMQRLGRYNTRGRIE